MNRTPVDEIQPVMCKSPWRPQLTNALCRDSLLPRSVFCDLQLFIPDLQGKYYASCTRRTILLIHLGMEIRSRDNTGADIPFGYTNWNLIQGRRKLVLYIEESHLRNYK